MTLLGLILAVVLFVLLYVLVTKLPAPWQNPIRIALIVIGIIVVVWLLLGVLPLGARIR